MPSFLSSFVVSLTLRKARTAAALIDNKDLRQLRLQNNPSTPHAAPTADP
jgi:hypothetical protein